MNLPKLSLSPTTALGWLRLFFAASLLGHVVYTLFAHGAYFIDAQMGVAYGAVFLIGDKMLGAVAGHFTADAPPGPKSDVLPEVKDGQP